MNPRRRRLLIPGLLVALIVIVVVASLTDRAEAATADPEIVLNDPRITESSGLAVSGEHPDLAYTVNDSGNAAEVFAIDLTSGDVVGVTTVRASFRDVEALALRDGTLWIADVGDNLAQRDDTALYAIDEPGRTSRTVEARRFPVSLTGGPADVEALLAQPGTDRLFLVTKSLAAAEVLSASESDLDQDRVTTFEPVGAGLPPLVTDGSFSPDGSRVALLSYGFLSTVDPSDWSVAGQQDLPLVAQTETIAFVGDDVVLVGSEGSNSPLHRVTLQPASTSPIEPETVATRTSPSSPTGAGAVEAESASNRVRPALMSGVGMLVLVGLGTLMTVRRRSRSGGSRRAVR